MPSISNVQKEAISHKDGPMMVLAGPGSGKTFVITRRVMALMGLHKVSPDHILVITFTKAAAKEMKERFQGLAGKSLPVSFGTFHSVFFTILKQAYNFRATQIIAEGRKYEIIREVIADYHLEVDDEGDFLRSLIQEISLVKGQMLPLDYYYSSCCGDEVFREIYKDYNERLKRNHWIDFDDILVYTYELVKEREDIRKLWQDKFPYILIDEFQDINKIQYEIIKMLAEPRNNLFIVGDDDQSIYKFRGAKPEIMKNFQSDYPEAKELTLNTNYRCSKEIVDFSQKIIQENKNRFHKDIIPSHEEGAPVELFTFEDMREENAYIVQILRQEMKNKTSLSDIAILYRTNQGPRQLVGALMAYNIPFFMRDGMPNLFEHWITKNIINYIKLAKGDRRRNTFLSVMNRPKRYIKREYLDSSEVSFDELLEKVRKEDWLVEYIEDFREDLNVLSTMTPMLAITYIRKSIGYNAFISEYARFRKIPEEELTQVLDELQESAKGYDTYDEWFAYMREYTIALKQQQKQKEQEKDGIVISTMHSAKGLEFQRVIIPDVNEDIIPHKKSIKEEDIEEERRMFYVAITRAKKYLHIFSVKKMYNKDSNPSRFLKGILERLDKGENHE